MIFYKDWRKKGFRKGFRPHEWFSKISVWFPSFRKPLGFPEYWFEHSKSIFGYSYFTIENLIGIFVNRTSILGNPCIAKNSYLEIPKGIREYLSGFWEKSSETERVSEHVDSQKGIVIFGKWTSFKWKNRLQNFEKLMLPIDSSSAETFYQTL